ncbi:hypothetical protein, partial [Sulfitobacter sp.]|uniref:hypothetical protein n=1 Tax=Sulfitobacter sp. TaxID=1903071 RepID=UPI0032982326
GQQANGGLWQCHLGMLLGNPDVTGQGTLQATPHGIAVHGRNRHATEAAEGTEGPAECLSHQIDGGDITVSKALEIGAGGEKLLTLAGHHQGKTVNGWIKSILGFRQFSLRGPFFNRLTDRTESGN